MQSEERRAPGATRMPFEGLVEVGGAMGPSFEAQAVNLSEDGMMLRTAYLPEPGQPLTCRFDAAGGQGVLAAGEVVWAEGADKGGEFAIRFTDMDPESVDALKRLCGVAPPGADPTDGHAAAGSKVRLHIEGLASPMRAKVTGSGSGEVTVGSDLGFLQVGKQLELEDAQSGAKRAAAIDRVEVQVDPGSHVPQLVVHLRYADAGPARAATAAAAAAPRDDLRAIEDASAQMKGAVARNIAKIGPAVERLANRAKTTIALLAARRAASADAAAPRRTTAPAPGGGLHAAGKRVVRGETSAAVDEALPARRGPTRRQAAIAGGVMIAAILGAIAIKKSHHEAAPAEANGTTPAAEASAATANAALPPVTPAFPAAPPPALDPPGAQPPSSEGPLSSADDPTDSDGKATHKKHGHVTPFGNGPVHHGNVLHLKMDGPIEAIEGAQQPTGFAVKLPGRKSAEAAGPLAARDGRIAAIKVSNEAAGAQLTVAFKDGVPNYQVSAKGDTLVIALAPAGETVANKSASGSHKHHKPIAKARP